MGAAAGNLARHPHGLVGDLLRLGAHPVKIWRIHKAGRAEQSVHN